MTDSIVPFWTLSTGGDDEQSIPSELFDQPGEGLTPARLERIRRTLAAFSDDCPILLERYTLAPGQAPGGGRLLAASSPLLKLLAEVVESTTSVDAAQKFTGSTELLYRMVVPKGVAGQMAQGLARPMSAGNGAVYGSIVGPKGIVANARLVPAAGTASKATGLGLGAQLVKAGPMVVMWTATAASIYAEEQRRIALERMQETLNEVKSELLEGERNDLNGAVGAITKATAILADEGRLGKALGLDAAVHAVDKAVAAAETRLEGWERSFAKLPAETTPALLQATFKGIDKPSGEFVSRLRMARLAIAMKKRVAILQAAEQTQLNVGNTLTRFTRELESDLAALDDLEQRVTALLQGLAALTVMPSRRRRDVIFTPGDVRELLSWGPRLRELAAAESPVRPAREDVELAIIVQADGRARVLEPCAIA